MSLKNYFEPICIEDEIDVGVYEISLTARHEDISLFGKEVDGENYRDDCWKCVLTKRNNSWYEAISYITNRGDLIDYCKVDDDFRNYIFEKLNI